jgi:hypothetical protein
MLMIKNPASAGFCISGIDLELTLFQRHALLVKIG